MPPNLEQTSCVSASPDGRGGDGGCNERRVRSSDLVYAGKWTYGAFEIDRKCGGGEVVMKIVVRFGTYSCSVNFSYGDREEEHDEHVQSLIIVPEQESTYVMHLAEYQSRQRLILIASPLHLNASIVPATCQCQQSIVLDSRTFLMFLDTQ